MKYLLDIMVLVFIYVKWLFPKWKKQPNGFIYTLFYIYIGLVMAVTLMPILPSIPTMFAHEYHPMHMIPFNDAVHGWGDYERQIILNILMFVPLGIFYPWISHKKFLSVVWVGFLLSLSIELIQPLLSIYRSSDITDVITNTMGTIVGVGIYGFIGPFLKRFESWISQKSS